MPIDTATIHGINAKVIALLIKYWQYQCESKGYMLVKLLELRM
jgi:hypothetical protein